MDQLEKIMKENKELFMEQEPAEGHFERFEKRLNRQKMHTNQLRMVYRVSRFAAVGLLVIMSSMWAINEFSRSEVQAIGLGDVNKEYQEVEFFFTRQINSKSAELQNFSLPDSEEYIASLATEMEEMDSVYNKLKVELGANPGDERIIEAMIMHYQTKLQILTDILTKLKNYKELSNPQLNNTNQYESLEL